MKRTHYEVLGIKATSSEAEIRSAYRKLVLIHHPDRSKDPKSAELFIQIQQAYEVLNNPERRKSYDDLQRMRSQPAQPAAQPRTQRQTQERPGPSPVAADVAKLASLFAKSRYSDAEALAQAILKKDPRQPIPYAVLGDLARLQGNIARASKMYAFALQMDPTNDFYLKKNEEMANLPQTSVRTQSDGEHVAAVVAGFALVVVACAYVALSREKPVLPMVGPISTWTLGLVVMLFLAGVSIGASLSLGRMLDRFEALAMTATGRVSPTLALGTIALINFWAAAGLYVLIGITQDSFNFSTSRIMGSVLGIVLTFAAAAGLSGQIEPAQVLLWGGNLAYAGAICGWMATDSLRG
ncbi:MAG TPA: DnaJ domain-containing protein [Fimbriimonadaceae bacterium]|nr:DnaJ domain-containing protein [Fimbriimonadaceae bacterium]